MIRRLRRSDDTGATLVLVLIIVTVVAVVVAAILSQADTSVRTTEAVRDAAGSTYNADGAAQVAINQLRRSTYNNSDDGTSCFGSTNTLTVPYPATNGIIGNAASSAAVVCTPEPGTGAQSSPVPITQQNKPGNAILTLGQNAAEDGVHIKPLSSANPFRAHGSIVSDSNIVVTQGSLETNTGVFAHTGCTGTITSTPPPSCNAGIVPDPGDCANSPSTCGQYHFDPYYGSGAVPTYQPVPTNCTGGVVTFNPGYYDDANALNALTTGNGPCGGSVWWFKPGTYYFDFHNNQQDPTYDSLLGTGTDTWTVSRGTLLAGTPVDANGTVLSTPPSNPTVPGACENPIKSTSAVGVQFIFGGASQLVISGSGGNAANAEICGTYHADRPPIAIYGVKSGTDTTSTANGLALNAVTPGGNFTNATVTSLANADGQYATWTNGSGKKTGTVTLTGYAPANSVPAGSVLKSAVLRVVHREPASSATPSNIQVTITPNGGTALPATGLTVSPSTWKADTVDVTSALAPIVHSSGFSGASMQFSATMNGSGSEDLDTIQVDLTYAAPAFRGETTQSIPGNCLAATYTGGSAGQCAVLSTSSSYAGAFYVQGTTYVPSAVVDLTLNNITDQVLRFGVVSRSLWVKETGSLNYSGPVIEIPDDSPGYGTASTVVDLMVYVCPGSSVCSSSGRLELTARVQLWDPTGSPVAGARQVSILSWSTRP